MGAKKGKA